MLIWVQLLKAQTFHGLDERQSWATTSAWMKPTTWNLSANTVPEVFDEYHYIRREPLYFHVPYI